MSEIKKEDGKELHWYSFTFITSSFGCTEYKQTYMGYTDKKVKAKDIDEAKDVCGIEGPGALINLSYLGCMGKEEFSS